ncbi:helix-turn-helix domain-containing protein [Nitratireductor pacificus]|uniref:XRE family transcriptional regulator n=1 Tax=Nitratireductor pacificus pht-3B TaxID=391937 RepID=K2LHQ9_9HYPH|nr:XRE family transcriptional regulator [Nitratireductor pacificus]EKF17274.1 XRE family transcriptional regulator [Nitratireductor pacificus pht-3B]
MEDAPSDDAAFDDRIARRLRALRGERGWSLDALAARSKVSRATLSRLENAEVSPTASVLGRLCAAYDITVSRLMYLVEEDFSPLVQRGAQAVWVDPRHDFHRRLVSPPARALGGEVLECRLGPGTRIAYDAPPRSGLEHHLVLVEGGLAVTVDGREHILAPGDCLRYQLRGPSVFATPETVAARYLLFIL